MMQYAPLKPGYLAGAVPASRRRSFTVLAHHKIRIQQVVFIVTEFSDLSVAAVAGEDEPAAIATASSTAIATVAMPRRHSDRKAAVE